MKKSPLYPKYEAGDYDDYSFDPQVDFSEFLQEARKHVSKESSEAATSYSEGGRNKQAGEMKRIKKSWKKCLFSWWKADKNGTSSTVEPPASSHISKPRRGYASGPINGSSRGDGSCKPRRPVSGPLSVLFHPTKRVVESQTPYMCLDQLNGPHAIQSYGPVYLVT